MSTLVYDALLSYLPVGRKRTASRWLSYNGPCCVHNGQARPDTKKRSGILFDPNGRTSVFCFNCQFRTGWTPGMLLSRKFKSYFEWLGMPREELNKLDFKIHQLKHNWTGDDPVLEKIIPDLLFKSVSLPKGARPLNHWVDEDCQDPNFIAVLLYLESRGADLWSATDYFWTPEASDGLNRRVIIPFWWQGDLVGWTARTVDPGNRQRYHSSIQPHYVFNTEVQDPNWEFMFITEGPFDGLAINGLSMLGDKITEEQAQWLRGQGKTIIVVPDRVAQGGRLVDVAIREGWRVSFPRWDQGVKDAADATLAYGRLHTVWSIIDASTSNKLEIQVKRQNLR